MHVGRSLAVSLAFAALAVPAAPNLAAGSTVSFTSGQALAGAKIFKQNCSECHGAQLQGVSAPALRGPGNVLGGKTVSDAYTYITEQMPMGRPGSLSKAQYDAVMAFLLSVHGRKPGAKLLHGVAATADESTIAP